MSATRSLYTNQTGGSSDTGSLGNLTNPHSNDLFEVVVNLLLFPLISVIGFFFNLICIIVYWKIIRENRKKRAAVLARGAKISRASQHNDDLYMYLITSSISITIGMFIDIFAPLALCHIEFCRLSKTYFAQIYYLFGYIYLADVFETFSSLIDVVITIDRYAIIFDRFKFMRKKFNYIRILVVLFLICTLYYVPFILRKKIVSIRKNVFIKLDEVNTMAEHTTSLANNYHHHTMSQIRSIEHYTIIDSEFGTKKLSKLFLILQLFISELLVFIIMITFNILLAFSFREPHYIQRSYSNALRRSNSSSVSLAKRNVAKATDSPNNWTERRDKVFENLLPEKEQPLSDQPSNVTDSPSGCTTAENGLKAVQDSGDLSSNSVARAYQCSFIGKNRTKNFNLKEYNLTLMIITMSIVNLLGNSPLVIVFSLNFFFNMDNSVVINNLYILSNLSTLITYSVLIFIYYYFNSLFRETLNGLIFKKKK